MASVDAQAMASASLSKSVGEDRWVSAFFAIAQFINDFFFAWQKFHSGAFQLFSWIHCTFLVINCFQTGTSVFRAFPSGTHFTRQKQLGFASLLSVEVEVVPEGKARNVSYNSI